MEKSGQLLAILNYTFSMLFYMSEISNLWQILVANVQVKTKTKTRQKLPHIQKFFLGSSPLVNQLFEGV